MEKYLDIDVNSLAYSKLPKEEQLIAVKEKLNYWFNDKKGKVAIVRYKGTNKTIPYEMIGRYKDLCIREKALEKRVKVDFAYDDDISKTTDSKEETKKEFLLPSVESVSLDNSSIDDKIKDVETEMFAIFDMSKDYEKMHKTIVRVWYKGEEKYIPYSLIGKYKNLKKMLEDLEYEKSNSKISAEQKSEAVIEKKNDISDEDNAFEDEDLTAVWAGAFARRDSQKSNDDKKDISSGKTDNVSSLNDNSKTDETKKTTVRPLVVSREEKFDNKLVVNDEKNNEKKDLKEGKKKKNKKGFLQMFLAIPFIRKIADKKRKGKQLSLTEREIKRRQRKAAVAAVLIAVTTVVGSIIPNFIKKKNNKTNVKLEENIPSACDSEKEKTISEDEIVIDDSDSQTKVEDIVKEESSEKDIYSQQNNDISLDDVVTINNDSYIYTNSYDAVNENNKLTPYYSGSYDREVMGVVYNLNGNVYTIYSSDPDAYNKVDYLINQGAKEEAVLVVRNDMVDTGQYEGYYNIDSIKIKTRVR